MKETQEVTKNAITWIDTLFKTDKPQAHKRMGDTQSGFCCLGLGCWRLGIAYYSDDISSRKFSRAVGLDNSLGAPTIYHDESVGSIKSLVSLNDEAQYNFSQIARRLVNHPDWYFKPNIAEGIKKHYENVNSNFQY